MHALILALIYLINLSSKCLSSLQLNNELSLSLYKSIEEKDDNILYSPISILIGLGMLMEGAKNVTKKEIINLLNFQQKSVNEEEISEIFKQVLNSYDNPKSQVHFGNIVVIDQHLNLKSKYHNILTSNYHSLVLSEDINQEGEKIVEQVNRFVQNKTNNQIEKALNSLQPDTKFVLINTISFDAKWVKPFDKFMNFERTFYAVDGHQSKVTFMQKTSKFGFADIAEKNAQLIRLDYVKNSSMFILLPNQEDGLKTLLNSLTLTELESFIDRITVTTIEVQIPKFTFESNYDLISLLPKLGLVSPFNSKANFGSISDVQNFYLSQAVHKSCVKVDKDGTKASAFSVFSFNTLSEIIGMPRFIADHPFLFIIRDKSSNINLFVGVVNKL